MPMRRPRGPLSGSYAPVSGAVDLRGASGILPLTSGGPDSGKNLRLPFYL